MKRVGVRSKQIFAMTAKQVEHDKPHVARWCAEHILEAADVADRKMNANDLHNAAVALTLKMIQVAEAENTAGTFQDFTDDGGVIAAEELGRMSALILIRGDLRDRARAKTVAHEIATSLQRTHVARECYGVERVECTELDGKMVRHEIARLVEREIVE